jgi:hypothetical protein
MARNSDQNGKNVGDKREVRSRDEIFLISLRIVELLAILPRRAVQLLLLAVLLIAFYRISYSLIPRPEPDWTSHAVWIMELVLLGLSIISTFLRDKN